MFFSVITHIAKVISDEGHRRLFESWRDNARRVFAEEHVAFVVDDKCGVHPLVDGAFQTAVAAAIQTLSGNRYRAAHSYFDAAIDALEENPPETRWAIKSCFDAGENLFMLLVDSNKTLDASVVEKLLGPLVQRLYSGEDESAQSFAARFAQSFGKWVDAGQPYRHAKRDVEPHAPPLDAAIAYVSSGAAFLRWLAQLDRTKQGAA